MKSVLVVQKTKGLHPVTTVGTFIRLQLPVASHILLTANLLTCRFHLSRNTPLWLSFVWFSWPTLTKKSLSRLLRVLGTDPSWRRSQDYLWGSSRNVFRMSNSSQSTRTSDGTALILSRTVNYPRIINKHLFILLTIGGVSGKTLGRDRGVRTYRPGPFLRDGPGTFCCKHSRPKK